MAHFKYVAKDDRGRTMKGSEFAMSERELVTRLSRKSLTVISIKRLQESKFLSQLTRKKGTIGVFDMMVFCRQLSTLLKGGVPLIRGLEVIAGEAKNPVIQSTLIEMSHYIKQGDSFSASMKRMPELFSPLFISMSEAGERVGALDVMLERLAKYLGARDRLNKKMIAALSYPSAVVAFFFFAIAVMTLFLIPKFKSVYSSFGANLPAFTLTIFHISDFMLKNIAFILAGIVVIVVYIKSVVLKSKKGRNIFDRLTLSFPIFGDFTKKAAMSRFTRTLGTLLEQGIPVPESLDLVARSAGNSIVEEACQKASKLIVDGEKIPEAFRKAGIFPPLVIQMAMIGTESGNLPELLDKTADFYEDEVDLFLSVMSSLIEPILIIVLGAVLAVFIVALYLPIFKMSSAMGTKM